jgi:hypothetical protein
MKHDEKGGIVSWMKLEKRHYEPLQAGAATHHCDVEAKHAPWLNQSIKKEKLFW